MRSKSARKQAGTPARQGIQLAYDLARKTHHKTISQECQDHVLIASTSLTACFEMVVISPYTYQVKHV